MKNLASILCDGGEKKDFRRNIYLRNGRLICDKTDITPMPDKYQRTQEGTNKALDDIAAMYSAGVWELEFNEHQKDLSSGAAAMGRKGGAAKTEAKTASSRENGKLGGRPKKIEMLLR
jgi:hypothetical protein